jgi:hypothetical protein
MNLSKWAGTKPWNNHHLLIILSFQMEMGGGGAGEKETALECALMCTCVITLSPYTKSLSYTFISTDIEWFWIKKFCCMLLLQLQEVLKILYILPHSKQEMWYHVICQSSFHWEAFRMSQTKSRAAE